MLLVPIKPARLRLVDLERMRVVRYRSSLPPRPANRRHSQPRLAGAPTNPGYKASGIASEAVGQFALAEVQRRIDHQLTQLRDYLSRSITVLSAMFALSGFAASAALSPSSSASNGFVLSAVVLSGLALAGLAVAGGVALFQPQIESHLDPKTVVAEFALDPGPLAALMALTLKEVADGLAYRAHVVSNVVFAAYLVNLAASAAWIVVLVEMRI